MSKKSFWEIFNQTSDGSLEPKKRIQIGGVQFGPGVRFGRGVAFGGVDLAAYIGHDLEVEERGDLYVITGIY